MGKYDQQYLHQQQQQTHEALRPDSSGILCQGCSMVLQRFANEFSLKCLFVLILSFSVLLSGVLWVVPRYTMKYGFDAKDEIKLSATVQACFRLEKPVSQLIPYTKRLEYDIYSKIGVPNTKVAILSMHRSVAPNLTDVVFGVLSDPMNVSINPVFLSVLRSSFIDLFFQQYNLTLTTSIFGNASMFKITKFSGGVTVMPEQSASIWQIPQVLFNFTINNSISEVLDNFADFKDELKFGLDLKSDENVYVQITNVNGSTVASPVIVHASVMSSFGGLLPQRLKQLAQTITGSPAKNLGLDNSVFGRVKEIRLSSFLKGTLHAMPPSPSPAPSPQLIDNSSPSYSPISQPTADHPPCFNCEVSSPAPSIMTEHPPDPSPYSGFTYPPSSSPKSYSKPSFPPDPDYSIPAAAPTSYSVSPTTEVAPDLVNEASHNSKPSQASAGADFHREIFVLG